GNWPSNVVNINRRESGTSQPVYPEGAPQLAQVGVPANTPSIFSAYANQFPSSNPFNLPYSTGQQGGKQVRLVAPHHVLDGTVTVNTSSQNYIDLNTWFDKTLENLFMTKLQDGTTFSYYQTNQTGGTHGTLWTGKVLDVTPASKNAITSLQYLASDGTLKSIDTKWGNWNDTANQTYKVLQLVGNAYDKSNFPNPTPKQGDTSKLVPGEYEGSVVNIYFPYFTDNTSLTSLTNPDSSTYTIPLAPSWANTNMAYSASEQVFGCNGVFASNVNDPEAISQNLQVALGNIENVIVSSVNRGVAFNSQGNVISANAFAAPIGFSQFPTITAPGNDLYTYYLAGVLPTGQETAVSPPMTVSVNSSLQTSATLNWLPVDTTWCESFKLYRQNPDGSVVLANNGHLIQNDSQVSSVTDTFANKGASAIPIRFYSGWQNQTFAGNQNSNPYSAFLHQNYTTDPNSGVNIGAICYGYPFDDQGSIGQGWSTNISFAASATLPHTIFFDISGFSSTPLVSTTATLSSNNNPSHLNDAVTFTATVSPASGTVAPTGTVSFYDGATLLGTGTLSASGLNAIASFTTSSLTVGAHSITAAYGGSNAFDPSTSGVLTQTVDGAPPSPVATSVVVASNINPSNLGQTVTFTATVTAAKGIPSGTVNFLDGTTIIGTGTLNTQGFATFQTSTLAVGTHLITAAFQASATYSASTSSVVKQVVAPDGPASTATTLVPNPNPTYAGHTVTFTATVAALRGTQVPTGTVTFLVDGTVVGSAQLSNGVATLQHAFATAGTYSLTANYQGDTSFAESQSPTATEVVNQPSSSTVKVTLSSSVNPSTQGQMVLFTAKLQPVAGSGSPTGTVDFYVNNVWQNSTTVFTDGSYGQVATWLTNALPLGDNSITAKYRGDSSFDPANSKPLSQVVTANPNQIMQPADLGPGSYVAGVGNLLAIKPSFGEMQFFQPFPNYNGQITVNTMDRDSDGKADTILAAVAGGAAPHVLVIDANTGYLLSSFYAFAQGFLGGVTIAGGPVHLAPTGSATPVVVCGARAGAQPTVAVFDALGNDYGAFFAFDPAYKGGVNVAMSEANAQGNALVVVSSTINTHVKVFDIANVQPSELASYYTFGSANYSPGVWASAGDIDGNATQELLVGTAGGTAAARIKVYNLLTGSEIPGKVIKPFGDNYLGSVRVGLSDYNRDGVLDLLAASGPMAMGTVRAFDFNTLAELESLFVSNVTDGVFIATNFSRAGVPT
ncbi:MAG: Ig-like domain repeat protein, partial [Gemmataceae bacterium]